MLRASDLIKLDIIFLGHSAFKIKGKTASLVIDPFDPKMTGLKFPTTEADIVLSTHAHSDHSAVELVKNTKKVIAGPGEYEIMGISIIGFSTFHDNKKGEERGKNTVYVIETDGLRVCHLGDLGHTLTDSLVEEIGDIDILMIPVGGFFTLDVAGAVKTVQDIEPRIIIPMHFKEDGLNPEIAEKLNPVDSFLKEVGLSVENLPKLSIKKEELGEGQKVVVLERKM